MAPEVISGKGYSLPADIWSLGVCLYEFMCGELPYGEDLDNPFDIYKEIMNKVLTFPSFVKDKESKKIMLQLLSKNTESRLGGSYATLKAHRWFVDFDWVINPFHPG